MSKSVHPQATCSLPYFVIMTVFFEQQIPNINNVCGRAHLALSLSHTHTHPAFIILASAPAQWKASSAPLESIPLAFLLPLPTLIPYHSMSCRFLPYVLHLHINWLKGRSARVPHSASFSVISNGTSLKVTSDSGSPGCQMAVGQTSVASRT